jgi:hypothetical protein
MGPPYRQSGADIAFWVILGLFAIGEYAMQFRSFRSVIRRRSGKRVEGWSLLVVVVRGCPVRRGTLGDGGPGVMVT